MRNKKHWYCSNCDEENPIEELACMYCDEEQPDPADEDPDYGDPHDDYYEDRIHFADPGGRSALRAESYDNPRNFPCPTCDSPNRLTPADVARGYQCDSCANKAERGWD